jgi:hypothetical protein
MLTGLGPCEEWGENPFLDAKLAESDDMEVSLLV